MKNVLSFVCGLIFGAGLLISGMADPNKVIAFLDVTRINTGGWDPSLLFVICGALLVYLPIYLLVVRRRIEAGKAPVYDSQYHLPQSKKVDRKLVLGATLFGLGWGMVGICPGPAITIISFGGSTAYGFATSMLVGIITVSLLQSSKQPLPLTIQAK